MEEIAQKLQALGTAVKNFLLWVLTPIAVIAVIVFECFVQKDKQIEKLSQEVAKAKGEADVKAAQDAKKDADKKEADYNALAEQYDRESHGAGGDSAP